MWFFFWKIKTKKSNYIILKQWIKATFFNEKKIKNEQWDLEIDRVYLKSYNNNNNKNLKPKNSFQKL